MPVTDVYCPNCDDPVHTDDLLGGVHNLGCGEALPHDAVWGPTGIDRLECGVCGKEFTGDILGLTRGELHFKLDHPGRTSHYDLTNEHEDSPDD